MATVASRVIAENENIPTEIGQIRTNEALDLNQVILAKAVVRAYQSDSDIRSGRYIVAELSEWYTSHGSFFMVTKRWEGEQNLLNVQVPDNRREAVALFNKWAFGL